MGCTQSMQTNLQTIIDDDHCGEEIPTQTSTEAASVWLCDANPPPDECCEQDEPWNIEPPIHTDELDPVRMSLRQAVLLQKYDLDSLHLPLLQPFLGSMYWTAATPLLNKRYHSSPSVETTSCCSSSTSPVANTCIARVTPSPQEESDDENDDDYHVGLNAHGNSECMMDKDIIIDGNISIPQTPRRLFDEEEMVTPSRLVENKENLHLYTAASDDTNGLFSGTNYARCNMTKIQQNVPFDSTNKVTPPTKLQNTNPPSPNTSTFYGPNYTRRERQISTLPSQIPIRLRITENRTDSFSYDPYYSSALYVITQDGRPYGNGLKMRAGSQFMTLQDGRGTLAVIKSRFTHVPSSVIYAPKVRFGGQGASGHRLSSVGVVGEQSNELFPWALVRKEGRGINDSCTVHLVEDNSVRTTRNGLNRVNSISRVNSGIAQNSRMNSGIFPTIPSFRGRHFLEGEWKTHTLVTRVECNRGMKEVPCCVIVRDPRNVDCVDVTVAPGIDPLLMICYLGCHEKMDVEPIMGGF